MVKCWLSICTSGADAIAAYEKAFGAKAENYDHTDGMVAHAEMTIHGQRVWLNDAFGNREMSPDCGAAHPCLTFGTKRELLACYEALRPDGPAAAPFIETPYSELAGNFLDRFGVLWGMIVTGRP